jgi:hypothetical protein
MFLKSSLAVCLYLLEMASARPAFAQCRVADINLFAGVLTDPDVGIQ